MSSSFWDNLAQWAQQASSQLTQQTTYAQQFYAQQANSAFQSGAGNNWAAASFWDAVGGFVAMGTGNAQSPGQALWSIVFSVPSGGITGDLQTAMGSTAAISNMFSSIGSQTPMSLPDWASSMIGMGGAGIGKIGEALGGAGGQIFQAAANGLAWGGFLDNAAQTAKSLPQVGGVLFAHCDTVLTGIDEIVGARWDEKSRSIVLVGKPDAGGNRPQLSIPALDADHLKVALRAAIAGQPLGVSIDPPANYRYAKHSGEMLPDGSPLIVSYLGDTAGTLFGAIMFESDRIMKCLSVGIDNQSRKPFAATVPGFRDLFTKSDKANTGPSWHRFWFVIDSVTLRKAAQDDAVLVDDVHIKVLTELEMPGSPKGQGIDPYDQAFADHITKNYSAYARQFPVLCRLRELAKISAIAQFLVDQKVPLDIGFLFQELPAKVDTPETTPSILRVESTTQSTRQMSGGVDLNSDPTILPDVGGKAERFSQAVNAADTRSSAVWSLRVGGELLQARSVPLTAPPAFRKVVLDHCFPSAPSLTLNRIYDSCNLGDGDFGPGWSLFFPYTLRSIRHRGKKTEVLSEEEKDTTAALPSLLILRNTATGNAELYRPTTTQGAAPVIYARVISQHIKKGAISFECDMNEVIHLEDSRFHLSRQSMIYVFDLDGRLIELWENGRCLSRITYRGDCITRIANDSGQGYELARSDDEHGSVTSIKVLGETSDQTIAFTYYESRHLKQIRGSLSKHRYCYDLRGNLAEIRDFAKNTCEVFPKPDAASTEATIPLAFGTSLRKEWVAGRLASAEDDLGCRVDMAYSGNVLKQISIRGRDGTVRKFDFDTEGYLRVTYGPSRNTSVAGGSPSAGTSNARSVTPPSVGRLSSKSNGRVNPVNISVNSANAVVVQFS